MGAICGIGGGVIIKPVLDLFEWMSVSSISFLSGCTVLSMSCYSVIESVTSRDNSVDTGTGTPLAVGAALGGIEGKELFTVIREMSDSPNTVGAVQEACLAVITLGTLLYTVNKSKIKTHHVTGTATCVMIGMILGISSSFLGIGGGPINLVVLYFFFSMDTKTAAANSLYIILISQFASLLMTIGTHTVPEFMSATLVVMVCGGILGGVCGRYLNKKLSNAAVDKLFVMLMVVIIVISIYNTVQYLG